MRLSMSSGGGSWWGLSLDLLRLGRFDSKRHSAVLEQIRPHVSTLVSARYPPTGRRSEESY